MQPILNSQKFVNKSHDYDYLHPWLGTGLLTSTDRKWHSRRKVSYKQRRRGGTEQCKLIRFSLQILTPAFHFKILDDFIDVFNEQSAVLARKLAVEVGSEAFNLFPYVTLCTLDIVCGESHAVQGEVSPQVSTNRLLIASQKPPWDARSTRRATASRSTSRRSMGKRKNRIETISTTEIQFGVGRGSCCAILRAVRATVSGSDMFPHTPISHYDLCVSARF